MCAYGHQTLAEIDWAAPWLAPYRHELAQWGDGDDWLNSFNASAREHALVNAQDQAVYFVPQACLPPGQAYESHIWSTGQVPTRDNLHDFFNALMWLHFPLIKQRLNQLQAAAIERHGTHQRDRLRDALTLFDENAVLLVLTDEDWRAVLRQHDWHSLFVRDRDAWHSRVRPYLFGHALLEKLVQPFKAITGHCWLVLTDEDFFALDVTQQLAWLDHYTASRLDEALTTQDFSPLPIAGIPGWWGGVQDPAFYADTQVFRPRRHSR